MAAYATAERVAQATQLRVLSSDPAPDQRQGPPAGTPAFDAVLSRTRSTTPCASSTEGDVPDPRTVRGRREPAPGARGP
jgi:hypothetical protein